MRPPMIAVTTAGAMMVLGTFGYTELRHPSLEQYRCLTQRASRTGEVRARFLGTSSILFEDGGSAVLADGFVSRPGKASLLWQIGPDKERIKRLLDSIDAIPLGAVFTLHSHYDHALDTPELALRSKYKPRVLGSRATVERATELGVKDAREIHHGDTMSVGGFRLTFYESKHGPPEHAKGDADRPVHPRAFATAWKTGKVWSVFIAHGSQTILVHGSAGFIAGSLPPRHADVVYLGIAGLARQTRESIDSLWDEVVTKTGAKRVILVHWDDFTRSLDEPLVAMPAIAAGPVPEAIDAVLRRAKGKAQVLLPTAWTVTDPFADPPGPSCTI